MVANLDNHMKRIFILFALFLVLTACNRKNSLEKAIETIPVDVKVQRFDKIFYESSASDLPKLKDQFPFFFPEGNDDRVWLEKMSDPQWRELYGEVQKKFPDFESETNEIENLVRHIKHYFPATSTPEVITLIAEMDYNTKAIYADSLILVSLELYLGSEHKFYQFPEYLKQNFTPRQIVPDIAMSFSETKVAPPADNTLLAQMIYFGKELYLKDILIPDYTDAEKIGYKPEQIAWCEENENYMWRYLIEGELLYASDSKLPNRFINPAPFSKFYLEIDNESPGRVGQWIGWQIVRAYMENNKVSVNDMLKLDAKTLFEKSKYKPKKE